MTISQFENIILRTEPNGSVVLLKDVARVERGAESYQTTTRLNGKYASGMSIQLASGANALETAKRVKAEVSLAFLFSISLLKASNVGCKG